MQTLATLTSSCKRRHWGNADGPQISLTRASKPSGPTPDGYPSGVSGVITFQVS